MLELIDIGRDVSISESACRLSRIPSYMTSMLIPTDNNMRMPQAHRTEDMGEKSRTIAAGRFSDQTLRNVNVINGLESKLARVKLHVLERNAVHSLQKYKTDKINIEELRQKRLAYQKVVANHPIATAPDYEKALDEKYTLYSFRHEIKDMLHTLHPDTIRKKRSQALIEVSRQRYQTAIQSSQIYFNSLLPLKPSLLPLKPSYPGRQIQFKPSWHQEPVFVPPLPKIDTNNYNKNGSKLKGSKLKEAKLKEAKLKKAKLKEAKLKEAYMKDGSVKEGNKHSRMLPAIRQQVSRKDRYAHDKLPPLDPNFGKIRVDSETDEDTDCVSVPSEQEKTGRHRMESSLSQTSQTVDRGEYKAKIRVKKRNNKTPSVVNEFHKIMTKKQYGNHSQKNYDAKVNETKNISNIPIKPSEKKHDVRNDSGYGTAESDFEITPRLKDGKEWKIMSKLKTDQ